MNRISLKNRFILTFIILTFLIIFTSCQRKVIYQVTFDLDDGVLISGKLEQEVENLDDLVLPVVYKTGYEFITWNRYDKNNQIILKALWQIKTYQVTFLNYDDSILEVVNVSYNNRATCCSTPLTPISESEIYTFNRWDLNINNVTSDITTKAIFTKATKTFTLTFLDYDDTIIETKIVDYNDGYETKLIPRIPLSDKYVYTFEGWDHVTTNVKDNLIIKPLYNEITKTFKVTFMNSDNTILDEVIVNYGNKAETNKVPTKETSIGKKTNFVKWDQDLTYITKDTITYPEFTESTLIYEVTFINDNNEVLYKTNVEYGQDVIYEGETPTKEETVECKYFFSKWDHELTNITSDTIIKAKYNFSYKKYTCTFLDYYKEIYNVQTLQYNSKIISPSSPMPIKENGETMVFEKWDPVFIEGTKITCDVVFTAIYTIKPIEYTYIIYPNNGSNVIETIEYEDSELSQPLIDKNGYHIAGCYKDPSFTPSSIVDYPLIITEDTTVYIKWIKDNTIEYILGDYIYETKKDLFNAFFTDFYYFILSEEGNKSLKNNGVKSLDDFLKIAADFNAGRGNMRAIGDIAGSYYLIKKLGGKIWEQPVNKFVGYCYQNNKYVDFLFFQIDFFSWWRQDEGYTTPTNNGSDYFAEGWAPVVDMGKFFYYTEDTSYVKTARIRDCFINIPGVIKTVLPTNLNETNYLPEITRSGYLFEGWYDNKEFNGSPITVVEASLNKSLTLYAKWLAI